MLAGSGSTVAPAASSLLPQGALAPTERQRLLARRIGTILEQAHYRRAAIDDRMSVDIYHHYLDSLDSQRSYFLASDIAEFDAWKERFDDMIRSGDVEPAFLMYARFQQRNRERIQFAKDLLAKEPDWTLKESFDFDREKAPWPASADELNELWRKRVKSDGLSLLLAGKTWAEATDTLRQRYERVLKRSEQVTGDEVFENLMNAYARTFDPHSNYFSARNSEEYRIQMSLSYEGIGATLQTEDDYASIVNLLPGGPAAVAGSQNQPTLNIKDRITAIAQGKDGAFEDVIGWRLDDVVQKIRGKGGTVVRFHVLPAGATPGSPEKTVELTRGKVTLEGQAAKKERKLVTRNGRQLSIGVINVPGFYRDVDAEARGDKDFRSTTRDVARLIEELRAEGPVDGLVLDLRGDGGGFLPEATALTGLFIDQGPVVQLKDYTGRVEVLDDPATGSFYDGPLVVLVDRYSASASEIFAGAIQDYGRGYVVGQRTFGKGTVQNLISLDRWTQKPVEGQLTVTIGKFYRVTGESTQHRGVEPDISLPSPIDMKEVGESSLDDALPWDRIAPARFQHYTAARPLPAAASLDQAEADRNKADPDFQWLVTSIAASDSLRAQKSLSLNLADRKAERERLDADRLQRENQRRAAQGKPAFATVVEMDAADDVSGDKAPDILLDRTLQITADIVTDGSRPPPRTVAKRQDGAAATPAP
ncbi:MAG TPA: carboxy terminal-processing peptidase [Steroidobacteraceae bacterium]|nr:carboxy terminal-processing peptidase [Steroidobacteraceae bacterium]